MLDSFASVLFSSIPLAASSIGSVVQGVAASAWSILQVAIGLGFVIFVHELGHFLAAKFFGVKCEKFYIGFDVPLRIGPLRLPSALGKFQWGETEYGIGMIPLGGYVKMLGQDDDPRRAEQEAARIRQKTDDGEDAKVQLDPRSFPAKPVYARMIIISAGVVMNLIFAILMAAYAYRSGVPYQPTIVGGLMPGDPAWQAGIEPGDQVIQVVDMKKPNLRLPFMDMMTLVAMSGLDDKDRQIPIKVLRNGSEVDFSIVGTQRHDPDRIRTLLGIQSMHTTKFVGKHPIDPFMLSEVTETPFGIKTGDVVVAIDGYELPKDERLGAPLQNDLYAKMSTKLDSPVTLKLKRTTEDGGKSKDEFLEATIPPLAMKTLGLQFAVDGVAAIRKGSLAEKAGIEVGDRLLEFNGKPIEDGMTLRLAAIRQAGKEVVLKLRRANGGTVASEEKKAGAEKIQEADSEVKGSDVVGKDYEVRWTVPTEPVTFAVGMQTLAPVGYDLPGLGMVYSVSNEIIGVQPGSKAAEVGLMPGDRLKQIQLEPSEKLKEELKEFFRKESFEARPIDNFYTALWTHEFLQSLPLGLPVRVFVERGGKIQEGVVPIEASPQWNWNDRGLQFDAATLVHSTESLGEAATLGVMETGRRMTDVFKFLKLLVTGKAPTKILGGPGMIAYQASSAASEGVSKLLMFLVMLSANLAILNFLPIPALDGGHMVFLTAEAILGKPVSEKFQAMLTMVGVCLLLSLMAFVIFNDVRNFSRMFGG